MVDVATPVLDLPEGAPAEVVVNDGPSGLEMIISGKVVEPRRTLLYGVHGIGKSTWAASAPSPIFVTTEEGVNDIDCDKFPLAQSWSQFESNLSALAMNSHKYKTVVIDSLDWLEKLIWAEVCAEKGVSKIVDIGWAKGYEAAVDWWNRLIKALTYLRNEKNMAVILLAHSKVERFDNPEGDGYNLFTLALHKYAGPIVQEWCDEVFFANYKVYAIKSEEANGKTSVKGTGGSERIIRTQEKPFCKAKNRLGMPEEVPLSWAEYAKYLPKA